MLIAIPALHLFICFFYLFFYQASFGRGLENFASPRDIFSVSISRIGIIYLASAIILLVIFLFNFGVRLERSNERMKARKVTSRRKLITVVIMGTVILTAAALGPLSIYVVHYNRTGFHAYTLLYFPSVVFISIVNAIFFRRYGIASKWVPVAAIVVAVMLSIAISGMNDAQEARAVNYEEERAEKASCGNFVVLLPVGDLFLAVGTDNARVLIDENCQPKFSLYQGYEFRELVRPHLFADTLSENAITQTAPQAGAA